MFGHYRSRGTLEQEKTIAQAFVKFLEDSGRKQDMLVIQLKNIYQGEFRSLNPSFDRSISFSRVLNALTYHLNVCQQLQDRVIFGGGEAAALQLLTDDSVEPQENDDLCYRSLSSLRPFYCEVCKRGLGNAMAYQKHLEGVKHRQQKILITIRKSLKKPELVFDKNGIRVTSDPAGDEHGVIELKVESGTYGQIVLIIENLSEEIITLKDITLLWSVNFFDYREISSIGPDEGQLYPGKF
ncbi:uncharacterized protein LOC111330057 [Stylophora pistillata]|uniref:uncharacterized protein LOC111330057 n=1 Tax=Stylophora pistillata TaxID=50429 RepID=UPI000C04AA89|nr:uncharacterized protein LOC111330057 [Stylophora pistillata]